MIFQRNAWYVVAFSRDVNRQLQRRVIMDEPILFMIAARIDSLRLAEAHC
jgi:phenylpropionate dioxygenase-like ring-hydroxylating dioxygenase large terminal subunit